MSGELGALIRGAETGWEQVEAGQQLDQVGRARLVGRARRARSVRAVAVAAAAVLLVGGAAGGALLLTRPDPVPPVGPTPSHTAAPSPSQTPTPTPTSTPTPTQTAPAVPDPGFAGTVTVDPHLPSAEPITPEVWAQAGSGWVLASYREVADGAVLGPQVIYLISPDGVRYQVVAPENDATVEVVSWRPGATSAVVALNRELDNTIGAAEYGRLDLVSGAVSPLPQMDGVKTFLTNEPALADGRAVVLVADFDEFGWATRLVVDADGTTSHVPTIDAPAAVAAVRAAYPRHTCDVVARFDASSVVLDCRTTVEWTPGHQFDAWLDEPLLLRVRDDGSGPIDVIAHTTERHPGAVQDWSQVSVVDGKVIVTPGDLGSDRLHSHGCTPRYVVSDGQFAPLATVGSSSVPDANTYMQAGQSGTSVYTSVSHGCENAIEPAALVREDLATGQVVELVPYPVERQAEAEEAGTRIWQSLTGWYVVP